ncbi:hypothetical protein ACT7CO_01540 [Bacillus pacificus]
MSHARYTVIFERTFMTKQFYNEKPFPYDKIYLKNIEVLTYLLKKGFGNDKLLEVFFRFEQKKTHTFYINFYFDSDTNTWEMKELQHLSVNPLHDINAEILYVSKNSKKIDKEIKKQIGDYVLKNNTIRKLPLFK